METKKVRKRRKAVRIRTRLLMFRNLLIAAFALTGLLFCAYYLAEYKRKRDSESAREIGIEIFSELLSDKSSINIDPQWITKQALAELISLEKEFGRVKSFYFLRSTAPVLHEFATAVFAVKRSNSWRRETLKIRYKVTDISSEPLPFKDTNEVSMPTN